MMRYLLTCLGQDLVASSTYITCLCMSPSIGVCCMAKVGCANMHELVTAAGTNLHHPSQTSSPGWGQKQALVELVCVLVHPYCPTVLIATPVLKVGW
eukprot:250822-Amphidinium_carterae.1